MKSKQSLKKTISKSTALLMIGATVIASGAGMNVYAKDIKNPNNIKVSTYKTTCNKPLAAKHMHKGAHEKDCILKDNYNKPHYLKYNSCTEDYSAIENCKPSISKPDTSKPNTDSSVSNQVAFENKVLELVNVERQKAGLNPLKMDESVRKVARLKSEDMRVKKYFDHTSPTYGSPFDMMKQFGITYRSAGENIAQGYNTPEAVVTGWMNSSGHRANILNSGFTHIGVGYDANGHYWTQMFVGK